MSPYMTYLPVVVVPVIPSVPWTVRLLSVLFLIIQLSMLDLIIIALFAGFLGIITYDFFTKKKTEVNGAHVVVGFHVANNITLFSCTCPAGVLVVPLFARGSRSSPVIATYFL